MEEFDGLLKTFPDSHWLLNESFRSGSDDIQDWYMQTTYFLDVQSRLHQLPTTDRIILGTAIGSNDGLGILPYPSILNLYAGGCKSWSNDTNCTEACGDSKLLFKDWQTQWNCLTLANMAINKPYPHNASTVGDTARALRHLAIDNLTAFDAVGVLKRFHNCASESWPKDMAFMDYETATNSSNPPNVHDWGSYIFQVCDGGNGWQNDTDLAGPGVLSSYIILIGIVFYAWACIRVLHIPRSIDWFTKLTRYQGRIYAFIRFDRSRLGMRIKHSTSVLAVELQEAQCFFILAVQVGLIYANSRPTEYFGTHDWRQVVHSRATMNTLTVIAALPVFLNQVTLHALQLDSIYSLSLCSMVFIMSYVASAASLLKGLDIDTIYRMSMSADNVKCGGFARMADLCHGSDFFDAPLFQATPGFLMNLCSTILCLLWYKKLWVEFAGSVWLRNYAQTVSKIGPMMLLYSIQLGNLLITLFIFSSEIILILYMALNCLSLFSFWNNAQSAYAMNKWPIGQVIAVLIWAPVISKYIYLLIFGVERAFAIRISQAFAVMRKPEQPSGQGN